MLNIDVAFVLSFVLIAFVALQHVGFLVLEMFLWQKPIGRKVFRLSPEDAATTAVLAANQGLYNGFLAAGLVWSLWCAIMNPPMFVPLASFFLGCVVVAGLYGGATAARSILLVQALPAAIALILLLAHP